MKKQTRKARVMVVDDSADTATTAAKILTMQGHIVITASSGSDALDAITEFRPDVFVLDIGMPKMDGHELARRIRQKAGYGNVIIVAVTGYGDEKELKLSRDAGIDHHLLKPIRQDDLTKILADWEARSAGGEPSS